MSNLTRERSFCSLERAIIQKSQKDASFLLPFFGKKIIITPDVPQNIGINRPVKGDYSVLQGNLLILQVDDAENA